MRILLISPPFTQLNSPYASIPYLKGFLRARSIEADAVDLGIRIACSMFSEKGLERLRSEITFQKNKNSDSEFFLNNFYRYTDTVGQVMEFLKGKKKKFDHKTLPAWTMVRSAVGKEMSGLNAEEYSEYICSLFLEDIFLFYRSVCPDYGFSRYGEKLAQSPPVFTGIRNKVTEEDIISGFLDEELDTIDIDPYGLVALTIPFPGTLTGALKAAKHIKQKYPEKVIVLGGGYVNTELRQMTDPGIFEFADYICMDDGEEPVLSVIDLLDGKITRKELVRTYYQENHKVVYSGNTERRNRPVSGTPDYSGIDMELYLNICESVNPMMRLWSGRNTLKLRLAKGCYWHKCAFCDTSLPYIRDYKAEELEDIIRDIENMTGQTGLHRFHFVDEALSPGLLVKLSLELLRRNIKITWWGNIRFDKAFTEDVCRLLREAGCIAAVGGMESACDRTLKRMNKGFTTAEAVRVMGNFSSAGILVHAYMIYGFPGETDRDMIESAEMLRQMFAAGILDSAYWHRFALTVHSPVFANADKYDIEITGRFNNPFANNDITYTDKSGNDPDKFGDGLKKAVYNWMHGAGTDKHIRSWFGFETPVPKIKKDHVLNILNSPSPLPDKNKRIIWLGKESVLKDNNIVVNGLNGENEYELPGNISKWLKDLLDQASINNTEEIKVSDAQNNFPETSGITFLQFLCNEIWDELFEAGLLII